MKAIILEDEKIAAQSLQRQLAEVAPTIEVVQVLQTVEEAAEWFLSHDEPDIAFMDIHLADGLVFHLFKQVAVQCPIIFTTAYNQYALEAFRVNSIDYLLKPIDKEELRRALNKYSSLSGLGSGVHTKPAAGQTSIAPEVWQNVLAMLKEAEHHYRSHFLIPTGDKLVPLPTHDIACIYIENKISIVITFDGQRRVIDKPLDVLMQELDPKVFYRANRQYIVAHKAVKDISYWFGNKLQLHLTVKTPESIVISKAKVAEFKEWYSR